MSDAGNYSDDSAAPDIETLQGDTGGKVSPDATHNLEILGGTNVTVTGIPGSNRLVISASGGSAGSGQTVGAVTTDIITYALGGTAKTYTFHITVSAFEATTPAGSSYELIAGIRTTGAAGVLIGTSVKNAVEEAALNAANITIVVAGNDMIVRAAGVVGLTINWDVEFDSISTS